MQPQTQIALLQIEYEEYREKTVKLDREIEQCATEAEIFQLQRQKTYIDGICAIIDARIKYYAGMIK